MCCLFTVGSEVIVEDLEEREGVPPGKENILKYFFLFSFFISQFTCPAAALPALCPCQRRTATRISPSAPPTGQRTKRRPK